MSVLDERRTTPEFLLLLNTCVSALNMLIMLTKTDNKKIDKKKMVDIYS